jgi:2',3'-cyclic-nucleotide 2'-phosphodiesterase (5'-nucleotidase family)
MSHSKNFQELLDRIRDNKDRVVAVVVHLNDTYLIEERPGRLPGFARLIATIGHLREYVRGTLGDDRVLVVHSGDFLGPSLLAKKDTGKAMVELLERVGLRYCVLGNHEFDHKAEVLAERVNRKKFQVVVANTEDPTRLVKVSKGDWWPPGTQHIAITGVVSESVHKSFRSPVIDGWPEATEKSWDFEAPNEALLRFLDISRNALFRIVLSHASQHEDRLLRRQIPALSRTYILGGHDHDIEWIENDQSVYVMKNLANCETVRVCLLLAGGESVVREMAAREDT